MACRLPPVTQFHSQVSVLSGYMVKLRIVAHSTQQAANPDWQNHIKIYWFNASGSDCDHSGNIEVIKCLIVIVLINAVSLSA